MTQSASSPASDVDGAQLAPWSGPPSSPPVPPRRDARTRGAPDAFAEVTLEGIRFIELRAHPKRLTLAGNAARERGTVFYVYLQLEGESRQRQCAREAHLHEGDFALCDGTQPHEIEFLRASRLLVLAIPQVVLRRHLPSPEEVVAIGMPGTHGISGLLSNLLRDFWLQCRVSLDAVSHARVAHAILELLTSAYAAVPRAPGDRASVADAQRTRILEHIESRLGDPELTPMMVARACGITARYLHHLFSGQLETVARYILRRRLEDCALAITDPTQRGRTVTAIAFERGFNSTTHFGRVFRARYGLTPGEYRRRHLRTVADGSASR
jgi:AraC-like DNA-binding protein